MSGERETLYIPFPFFLSYKSYSAPWTVRWLYRTIRGAEHLRLGRRDRPKMRSRFTADVAVITKCDLAEAVEFDAERMHENIQCQDRAGVQ